MAGGGGAVEVALGLQRFAETLGVIPRGVAGIVDVLVVAHVDGVLHIDKCARIDSADEDKDNTRRR